MHVFARTKFQPPRPRADLITRERLDQQLSRALATARLVLVSAPAGAGKTTLVATALATGALRPVWVALDADDDELLRFLSLLLEAFERSALPCGDAARRMLESLGDTSAADQPQLGRRIMAALINDLPDPLPAPYALVLDDLHAVAEPAIFAALDLLLERLPAGLTLVIATRHDPPLALGRLRARRELYDLRLSQLQFTLAETTALLNDRLGLALDAGEILPLHQRTEGWAAGLILLAASLEHISAPDERARFLERLARTDHYLFDYLAEEVLHRQEPFVRMFLLETSILTELTPQMCQVLTGRGDAGAILDDLYRRNLFLADIRLAAPAAAAGDSPRGHAEQTYRYHDLFRTFLQARLRQEAPEWWRVLHGRAAAAEPDMVRRASHLLHAEDWEAIADLIEQQGEELIDQGRPNIVAGWIGRLPAAVLDRRPRIAYVRGVLAIERRDLERGRALLQQALDGLAATDDARLRGAALVALASCCSMMNDFGAAHSAAEQALDMPLADATRVQLLAVRAHLAMGRGEWRQTAAALDEALALAAALGDARTLGTLVAYFFAAYGVLPPDGAARIERLCALIERLAQPHHLPLLAAGAQYRAWLLLWRGSWEAAQAEATRALALSDQADTLSWIELEIGVLLPTLNMLLGSVEAAESGLERLRQATARPEVARSMRSWLAVYLFAQARMRWLQGRTAEADALYQQMCAAQNEHEWPGVAGLRDQMAALLLLADADPAAAVKPAERAARLMERYPFTAQFGDARIVLAAALLRARRPMEALAAFEPALAQAAAEATPGRLRWEGESLIAPLLRLAFEHDRHVTLVAALLSTLGEPLRPAVAPGGLMVPETGETLSARELEVLRLIGRGASNGAIADALIISVHTAKHHVSHVLAKLGVATRTEAATRARDFGLL